MANGRRRGEGKDAVEVDARDVEQVLMEARAIARWAKRPFYIA